MSDLHSLVKEFWTLVDKVEESDGGRFFRPNKLEINSCRVIDGDRLNKIICEMRQIIDVPQRITDQNLYLLNNPDGCPQCLGKGREGSSRCRACRGSGSTDPSVCPTCKGTGDPYNHEREWHDCSLCKGFGRVKKCEACNGEGVHKLDKTVYWRDCETCDGQGVVADE